MDELLASTAKLVECQDRVFCYCVLISRLGIGGGHCYPVMYRDVEQYIQECPVSVKCMEFLQRDHM